MRQVEFRAMRAGSGAWEIRIGDESFIAFPDRDRYTLDASGRAAHVAWGETMPPQPIGVMVEDAPAAPATLPYATTRVFGGQLASVGRIVAVRYNGDILAGIIVAISVDGARPIIRMFSDRSPDARHDSAFGFRQDDLPFADVRTVHDIKSAPERCWFWPPRV